MFSDEEKVMNDFEFQGLVNAYASTKSFDELLAFALIFGDMKESYTKTKH